ncbi:MAG: hypothetical protein PVG49_19565 [Desulfobacteraceae bacterium]|jgi:hypothetical protein
MEIMTVVTGAWNAFATRITSFLPELLGAVIVFVAGWIGARLVKLAVLKFLKLVRFDSATEKAKVQEFLQKGEIGKSPSEIIGVLVYWFIMILVIIASLDALGLPIVSDLLNQIFLYIPNVVAAIIVIILGMLVGNLLAAVVRTTASNAGLNVADGLGKLAFYGILFFAGSIALNQLGVGEEIVAAAFIIAFGAAALTLSLAFGLGGRDLAAHYLREWLKKVDDK